MSLHNRWRIACFLCNFKGVPLLRGASAKFLISCSFHPFNGFLCRFRIFPLLWGAPSGKTADKTAVSNAFLYKFLGKSASRWDQMFPQVSTHTQLACHFDAYLVSLLKASHHQMAGFDDSRDIRCSYAISFQWHISAISMWPYITMLIIAVCLLFAGWENSGKF